MNERLTDVHADPQEELSNCNICFTIDWFKSQFHLFYIPYLGIGFELHDRRYIRVFAVRALKCTEWFIIVSWLHKPLIISSRVKHDK